MQPKKMTAQKKTYTLLLTKPKTLPCSELFAVSCLRTIRRGVPARYPRRLCLARRSLLNGRQASARSARRSSRLAPLLAALRLIAVGRPRQPTPLRRRTPPPRVARRRRTTLASLASRPRLRLGLLSHTQKKSPHLFRRSDFIYCFIVSYLPILPIEPKS